jgi:hypothetical protein
MVLKAFKNFQMQHRTKMLYCMKYIKLIVQLSRHFCGVGGRVLKMWWWFALTPCPSPEASGEGCPAFPLPS